jgi:hypothetical protein
MLVGTARCAVRAAFSGATNDPAFNTVLFRPLNAGGAAAARRPYLWLVARTQTFGWIE